MAARADYLNARAAWSAAIAEGQSTSVIAARKSVMEQKYDTYVAVIEQTLEDAGAM
jgi:YD repeat-containing protein